MEMSPVVFALMLLLGMQWLCVTALPTAATDLATDVASTTPDAPPLPGDQTVLIAATDSAIEEPDTFITNLDAPTTNPHILSAEGDNLNMAPSTFADTPVTTSKEHVGIGMNPTTVTMDQVGDTVGPVAVTENPIMSSTYWDSLTASTADVMAAQEGTITRLSTLDTSPPAGTVSPVAVTTVGTGFTTVLKTTTARPSKTRAYPVCPTGCECENLEVHCSRAGLVTFPEGLDPRTTYLDVGHNRLTAIADDELADLKLTKLTSLICDNNMIETVGLYAFRGLRDLALLQLSGNRIRQLSPFIFVRNTDLRHIDLTGNPLQLSHGPILMVQQLEWLDLDQCNITLLALDAFRDMRGLRYVNLSGNRISSLSLSHFSGLNYLRYIKLSGNPLLCDCEMKPVWRWFRQQTVHVDAKCIAPGNGSTQSWNFLEMLNCDTPRNP